MRGREQKLNKEKEKRRREGGGRGGKRTKIERDEDDSREEKNLEQCFSTSLKDFDFAHLVEIMPNFISSECQINPSLLAKIQKKDFRILIFLNLFISNKYSFPTKSNPNFESSLISFNFIPRNKIKKDFVSFDK